uniref:Uncharacterized protein n=1 Tax=Desertifilum tharense IPPAS B-1220 TaxID=1781255 RepID=A0ACD5GSK3_9CYAN
MKSSPRPHTLERREYIVSNQPKRPLPGGDEPVCNFSNNPLFADILNSRLQRRQVLRGELQPQSPPSLVAIASLRCSLPRRRRQQPPIGF